MKKLVVRKSRINGSGIFTTEPVKRGEFVGYVHGPLVLFKKFTDSTSKLTLNWIGATKYTWIDTRHSPFRYINHSCNPNVAIVTKRKVIALTDIPENTEVTMDYSLSESDLGWSIEHCTCKSETCRKRIGPIQTISESTYKKFKKYISKPFRDIYERSVMHRRADNR